LDAVRVRWVEQRQFVGWDEEGHGVVMDGAAAGAGEGTGVRPLELLLYGLAGCTAMDVVNVLEKKRLDVRGVEITATGEQRMDDYPHYYKEIVLEYVVTGVGITDAAVARAIGLSETKYCSVKGTLGPQVKITTSFRVVKPPEPGPRARAGEQGA
jgi:putative redox protein